MKIPETPQPFQSYISLIQMVVTTLDPGHLVDFNPILVLFRSDATFGGIVFAVSFQSYISLIQILPSITTHKVDNGFQSYISLIQILILIIIIS